MVLDILLKLAVALALGGVIGYEREHRGMPAGLRTHILVSVGSSLVQIISFSLCTKYKGVFSIDPLRLGAQVISGIGFLGAGAILKEGTNIKGLTTAASLWVVACIGLAVGSGLYLEAVFATALIFISLTLLKRIEEHIAKAKSDVDIQITTVNKPGQIGKVGEAVGRMGIQILNINMHDIGDDMVTINLLLKIPSNIDKQFMAQSIIDIDGIKDVKLV